MGTWGPGNLESDGALDEIAERSAVLVEQLWTRAQTPESWEADEWDHDALFVDFEILFALEKGHVFHGATLPAPEEVDLRQVRSGRRLTSTFRGQSAGRCTRAANRPRSPRGPARCGRAREHRSPIHG